MKKVNIELKSKVAHISINNPAKMNCLDMEMLSILESGLINIRKNRTANVIVIRGAGDKVFSTGGNLNDFRKLNKFHDVTEWIKNGNEVFNLLENIPAATIASINGYAMGGGLELALSCDLRIATKSSIFSMPELNHG